MPMIKNESYKIQEIDKKILTELISNLEIKLEDVNIIDTTHVDIILKKIRDKREVIFTLFDGDFSENESSIQRRMPENECEKLNLHDRVANNVILKRVEEVLESITRGEPEDGRVLSVCYDRLFFIQSILNGNISIDFVKKCIGIVEAER